METYVGTLVADPPVKASELRISINSEFSAMIDEKLKTAVSWNTMTPKNDTLWKSVLESKGIQDIGPVADSK